MLSRVGAFIYDMYLLSLHHCLFLSSCISDYSCSRATPASGVRSRTSILIFTLTTITCAWVYQGFMGSMNTQSVTTGNKSFIIIIFFGGQPLFSFWFFLFSICLSRQTPALLNEKRIKTKNPKAENQKKADPTFPLKQPNTEHAQYTKHSLFFVLLLCSKIVGYVGPDPFSFHCCSYPFALVQFRCCYCLNKLPNTRQATKNCSIDMIAIQTFCGVLSQALYWLCSSFVYLLYWNWIALTCNCKS